MPDGFLGSGIATIAAGGADLYEQLDGTPFVTAREGLVFPVTARNGDWLRVFTSCDVPAWVKSEQVAVEPTVAPGVVGGGFDFADAVVVLDPGHGGPNNIGAVGPTGLAEKTVNVLIAQRVRDLLAEPHVVDWETGTIFTGSEIPAARRVLVTRVGDDDAADYEAGLDFRAEIANRAGAHVMVSIHNNAGWELELEFPGSDVYYQSQDPVADQSRRLATLLTEEFQRSFTEFTADWVGAEFVGAKSRLSPRDGESQYYGLLRYAEVPSVIAEGLYLSNPSEEALLRTPQGQQAYAEAVYRAIVRFLTTDDVGGDSLDPEVWQGFAGSGSAKPDCVIPAQEGL
jgi:N-acetylmuramoyl-L-alanine amidase